MLPPKSSHSRQIFYSLGIVLFPFILLLLPVIKMGEAANQNFLGLTLKKININGAQQDLNWVAKVGDDDVCETTSSESSIQEDSTSSVASSSSSSDLVGDASSLPSSTLLSHANGPLYELSELRAELPVK